MKTVLVMVVCLLAFAACRSTREINVELVNAQLIRIDTIFRNSSTPKQQLTWRDDDNIEYVSIVSLNKSYPLGVTLSMLRQR